MPEGNAVAGGALSPPVVASPPSFEQWARAHTPRLLRVATLLVGERGRAEDLVQDVLIAALPKWTRIGALDSPEAYVVKMLVNRQRALARSTGRERRRIRLVAPPERQAAQTTQVDDHDEVVRAMANLGERQRAVLVLRHLDDLADDQIAEILGCSAATVRSQASRGLAKLRTLLTAETRTP